MKVTKETIAALDEVRKENLDGDIVRLLAEKLDLDAAEAMSLYYESALSRQVDEGSYGIQNLSAEYLVDDLLLNERELLESRGIREQNR